LNSLHTEKEGDKKYESAEQKRKPNAIGGIVFCRVEIEKRNGEDRGKTEWEEFLANISHIEKEMLNGKWKM